MPRRRRRSTRDATDALIRWQQATRDAALPPYDEALLARELALFPDWYVGRHLGVALTPAQQTTLAESFRRILDNNLAQPRVFVHRDFHSRNLMLATPNPGILDFQDAVEGPITYDLVSLLRDAYIEWDEPRQIDWAVRYWETRAQRGSSGRRRFRRLLARLRMDGRAAAVEGAGHFRPAQPSRRQGSVRRRHAARAALPARRLRALSTRSIRSGRFSTSSTATPVAHRPATRAMTEPPAGPSAR